MLLFVYLKKIMSSKGVNINKKKIMSMKTGVRKLYVH